MLLVNIQNQDHKASGVGEVLSKNVFIIYRRGAILVNVVRTIYINVRSPSPRRLHMKFGFDWTSGFGGDV